MSVRAIAPVTTSSNSEQPICEAIKRSIDRRRPRTSEREPTRRDSAVSVRITCRSETRLAPAAATTEATAVNRIKRQSNLTSNATGVAPAGTAAASAGPAR